MEGQLPGLGQYCGMQTLTPVATRTQTIWTGTVPLGTTKVTSGTLATTVTVAAPGVLSTDIIKCDTADISGVTGYAPSSSGTLTIYPPYSTGNNVNVKVGNSTAGDITPGSVVTLACQVTR